MLQYLNSWAMIFRESKKIGDAIIHTSLPENFYHKYGIKPIDIDKHWVFDHNPYVTREFTEKPQGVIDMANMSNRTSSLAYGRSLPVIMSRADEDGLRYGIDSPVLRHPRLYHYEDLPTKPNKIVVHTTGEKQSNKVLAFYEDNWRIFNQDIINAINKNYPSPTWEIVQIGSESDIPFGEPAIDKRGLPIWDSVKEIAEAAIFIGVNSGPMNIAFCYPKVTKKIILTEFSPEFLRNGVITPMDAKFTHYQWLDWSFTLFNRSEHDAGTTYSYLKI